MGQMVECKFCGEEFYLHHNLKARKCTYAYCDYCGKRNKVRNFRD